MSFLHRALQETVIRMTVYSCKRANEQLRSAKASQTTYIYQGLARPGSIPDKISEWAFHLNQKSTTGRIVNFLLVSGHVGRAAQRQLKALTKRYSSWPTRYLSSRNSWLVKQKRKKEAEADFGPTGLIIKGSKLLGKSEAVFRRKIWIIERTSTPRRVCDCLIVEVPSMFWQRRR